MGTVTRYSIIIVLTLFSNLSLADIMDTTQNQILRSSVEPGRALQSLTPSTAPPAAARQTALTPEEKRPSLSADAAKITFTLTRIKLVGATVLSDKELLQPYQNYLGKVISLGDIQTIVDQMTSYYQKAGYVLTRVVIPPQRIEGGVITLRVVEGFIDQISIQGNVRPAVKDLLLKYAQQIRAIKPLHLKELERYALLVNDLPGVIVKLVLQPSKKTVGAADLIFIAQQSSINGYLSADNRGTRLLGPQQYTASGNLNSIFRAGDTTGMQVVSTGDRELTFLRLTHTEPIGTNGLKLSVNAAYTHSVPGGFLAPLNVIGKSKSIDGDVSYPFLRSRKGNFYIHGGAGALESKTDVVQTNLYDDRIRYLIGGVSFDHLDSWYGFNQAGVDVTQGVDVLGASGAQQISRPNARPAFTKFNINASRVQALPYNFSLVLSSIAQYTNSSLYATEQFGFGGSDYGRGYDPSEITGDRGIAGKLELRFQHWINQYYAFYDIGKIWNVDTSSQVNKQSAASAGFGIRTSFTKWLAGNIEITQPITRSVATLGNQHPRLFVSISIAG